MVVKFKCQNFSNLFYQQNVVANFWCYDIDLPLKKDADIPDTDIPSHFLGICGVFLAGLMPVEVVITTFETGPSNAI